MSSTKNTHAGSEVSEPARPLRTDFTLATLNHARIAKARARHWKRIGLSTHNAATRKENLGMKLVHKPLYAILSAFVMISIGGTSYAAVNGGLSSITALFGGSKHVTGGRVVKVDLQNCHDINSFNIVPGTGKGDTPRYYQIKDSAHISDQQMVALAQSICRASYSPAKEQAAIAKFQNAPQNKDMLVGNAEGEITAITDHSIDIKVSSEVTDNRQPFVEHITNLDPQLVVFNGAGNQGTLHDLHVGDMIFSSYRAIGAALTQSETLPLNEVDWSQQALVSIVQQSPDGQAYDQYRKLVSTRAVQQVVPCHTTSNGYCTADQL